MTSPQPTFHPRPNYEGKPVKIALPDTPTPLESWGNAAVASIAIPDQPMPAMLNGISLVHWRGAPGSAAGWNALAAQNPISEPAFAVPSGLKAATGAIVMEPDGRVWLVAPTNRFGGYRHTFPKGTMSGATVSLVEPATHQHTQHRRPTRGQTAGHVCGDIRPSRRTRSRFLPP